MRQALLTALEKRYKAKISEADATIKIYLENPVGIGEHPQHLDEIDKQIQIIVDAKEKLEELGRVEAKPSNPNRRAEISRVHSELNRGYATGGRVGAKDGKWIQKVNKSIKARGTKGKCTPITKPGCTGRAKALAKTFKKMARERKSA